MTITRTLVGRGPTATYRLTDEHGTFLGFSAHAEDSTARAVDEEAADLAYGHTGVNVASAVVILAGGIIGAAILGMSYVAPCDPAAHGCRFADDGVTWQTNQGATWPVCPTEDAPGPCLWDATRDGLGNGTSFVVGTDGTVTYLP